MRRALLSSLALCTALAVTPAGAKTRIIALSSNPGVPAEALLKHIAEAVIALTPGDKLLVYSARPVSQIAAIALPSDPSMNKARINAALAAQFKPVRDYLAATSAGTRSEPLGSLMIPSLMDELSRNVISELPEKKADILLIGSLLYLDRRDGRSAMTDRYIPSDATLRAARADWVFSVMGAQDRLAGTVLHFCTPNAQAEYESEQHEQRVRRFWSLWTAAQAGRVGTFSSDLATCFRRFNSGEASGQTVYQLSREPKAEMLRVPAHVPATLPASFDTPGQWFLRDDAPIAKTPPSIVKGVAWVGLKWNATCDLDLYARGEASSAWLYFSNGRTSEGYFNKDFQTGTGDAQFEYVEFTRDVDLGKAEVAINLYSCDAAAPPEGTVRVWFAGKVYEAPFKLAVRTGNRGVMPIAGPHWLRVDLRKVVGLVRE